MSTPAESNGHDPDDATPADVMADLPEVEPGPDGGGPGFDPVLELSMLLQSNSSRMNELSQQGVVFNDAHPMITSMISNALLEEILRGLNGEGAVTRVLLETHQQIADMLTRGEQQVAQAKLMAPLHEGRVTQRPGRVR